MIRYYFLLHLLLCQQGLWAQDSLSTPKKWICSGYIKEMPSLQFDKDFSNLLSSDLLHNRINCKWTPLNHFSLTGEFRNRLLWGESVANTPGFAGKLRNANEYFNWQKIWRERDNFVIHSNVERLYAVLNYDKWNIRMGRQRINWGIATTWNPNDLFNTYNFLDFDYEERPGSDAVKVALLTGALSGIECVYARNAKEEVIAATRYYLNFRNYDWQLIGGWYQHQFTFGAGWAGNIRQASFKGEAQYFLRKGELTSHLNLTAECSYLFKKGWYVSLGGLVNSRGMDTALQDLTKLDFSISPKNIMPSKWNIIGSVQKEFTPLFSGSISTVFSPGMNLFILFLTLNYNLSSDMDASLVWQSFFMEINDQFRAFSHQAFLRIKYSF